MESDCFQWVDFIDMQINLSFIVSWHYIPAIANVAGYKLKNWFINQRILEINNFSLLNSERINS